MTGKEYLIDFMRTHSSEEIYDKIKEIERDGLAYNDSRLAFIGYLDDEYMGDRPWTIVQTEDGIYTVVR